MSGAVRLSVVIPAHNEEAVIERCVKSCLEQTVAPYEVIVVNDGSTDKTRSIVEGLQKNNKSVRILNYDKGHSAAFSRNRGAEAARGDVIFFMDADAALGSKDLVEKVVDKFSDSKVDAAVCHVVGEYKTFMQKSQFVRAVMSSIYLRQVGTKLIYVNCLRKKVFQELGGFDESVFYYEDREFGEKVSRKYKVHEIPAQILHNDPSSLGETIRQARYVGKGLESYNWILKNPLALMYPAYPFFWFVFAACALLALLDSFFIYVVAFLLFVLVVEALVAYYYTRMLAASVFFVFFLSPMRAVIILYSFARNRLKTRPALP